MWCGKCQSDVAAEVSSDNQRVFCASCGALLTTIDIAPSRPTTTKASDRTTDARDLLQRWSSGKVIDPYGPAIRSPDVASSLILRTEPGLSARAESSGTKPLTRTGDSAEMIDPPIEKPVHLSPTLAPVVPSLPDLPPLQTGVPAFAVGQPDAINRLVDPIVPAIPNPISAINESAHAGIVPSPSPFGGSGESSAPIVLSAPSPAFATVPSPSVFRIDAAHPALHFVSGTKATGSQSTDAIGPFASVEPAVATKVDPRRTKLWFPAWDPAVWRSEPGQSGGWSSLAGQFLAYAGVLAMTAGACLVVWSYFGGPANYAPTGWLLATAGQMLLFFGVVTLVSGGLEQTTEQVNKRIEQLGDHIIRIEHAAREMSLRGSSVPPAHFGHDPDVAVSQRSAASGHERSIVEE